MDLNEEKKIIEAWGAQAIKLMQKHDVSFLPENYSVWFEYVRGGNKKLKDAVDKVISEKKPFTHDVNRTIYTSCIAKDSDQKEVLEAGDKVNQIMAKVLKTIEATTGDTQSYNTELDSFTQELQSSSGGNVEEVISKLVSKTVELKQKGQQLQASLDSSKKEVESLKTNLDEVSAKVSIDGLTGVGTRKAFDERIETLMAESKAESKQLCLIMVDVDHFRNFNNTYGHLIGDQVLKIVSQAMKDVVKGRDFVARYGGEEFAILLPETPLKGGEIVGETIRKTIASRELKRKDTGQSYGNITVSIGVACFRPVTDNAESLIARADKALYSSKKLGRNRVTLEEV